MGVDVTHEVKRVNRGRRKVDGGEKERGSNTLALRLEVCRVLYQKRTSSRG